jgi:hypothetical protein
MNEEFWKQFPPIPGFDCVEMKHRAQERIARETQGMTDRELIEYFNRAGRAFRETGKIPVAEPESLVLREEPPKSG